MAEDYVHNNQTELEKIFDQDRLSLHSLLKEFDYAENDEEAENIADAILLIRQRIEKNLQHFQLDTQSFAATKNFDVAMAEHFFAVRGAMFLLIADAAKDTDDFDDAYSLYTRAVQDVVFPEQKIEARLGALFCRTIVNAYEEASSADVALEKSLEDMEEAITLINGDDNLMHGFIRCLYGMSFKERQTRIMYLEAGETELPPECISRVLNECFVRSELPNWLSDFFEGLVSYIDGQEPLKVKFLGEAMKQLSKTDFPESRKALRELIKVHG